jgi:hypothetical protein
MSTNIICDRLVVLQLFLDLINNSLVLEDRAVVREVDSGWLRRGSLLDSLRVSVTLAECLQGGDGLCIIFSMLKIHRNKAAQRTFSETERGVDACEVL